MKVTWNFFIVMLQVFDVTYHHSAPPPPQTNHVDWHFIINKHPGCDTISAVAKPDVDATVHKIRYMTD